MTDFVDVKKSLYKYSKKVVGKTGEYSKIAKLTLNIKKNEGSIEQIQTEIGRYVLEKIEKGETTLELGDATIKEFTDRIKEYEEIINAKKIEIEELKKAKIPEE